MLRDKKPIYTKTKLTLAVLFLYQVGNGFLSSKSSYFDRWFAMCYAVNMKVTVEKNLYPKGIVRIYVLFSAYHLLIN